ncbi:CPBP family glutamic-type intramembrane protease [Gracilimonas sp.]|uniref:type II CAAX prenyl endopeptidase Rce1 family protein n=1 Tax=Gracilimonas sp. TaxID=1974203 RepID=UPI0034534485
MGEEIYNRDYFINVFKKPETGLWLSAVLSVIFFVLRHLPPNTIKWFDILIQP